jgi:superfamily II DNA or RNA helicase
MTATPGLWDFPWRDAAPPDPPLSLAPVLRPYQDAALDQIAAALQAGHRAPLVVLPTGSGKCLGLGTPVLLSDGRIVPVELLTTSDVLMGPDSRPRRILSTTTGRGPLYRITPVRGEPWVHTETGRIIDVPIEDYLRRSRYFRHCYKQFAPPSGVEFPPAAPLPLDPYFLGVWYGDGTKSLHTVSISKPDPEIESVAREVAASFGLSVRIDGPPARCKTYHLSAPKGQPNHLLTLLRRIVGDGHTFPHAYLTASRGDRQAFLAGLLDTDGHLSHGGFEIVQRRKGYAEGVQFLARSLGLSAPTVTEKRVKGESYWRVYLSGDIDQLPLRLPRKQPTPRRQKKCATRTGFTVEPIGMGDYYGFTLDGDGRFLLGDYTVTHNTVIAAELMRRWVAEGKTCLFLAPRRELIFQTSNKLKDIGLSHGVLLAGADERDGLDAPVQVASVDTLLARSVRRSSLTLPDFDLVIVDEAHLGISEARQTLFNLWPNAIRVGLTATPTRKDGKALGALYDTLLEPATVQTLTDLEHLVPARYYSWPSPDLSKVHTVAGEYNQKELGTLADRPELLADVVSTWLKLAGDRRTVVFAINIAHSMALAAEFVSHGIAAEHVDAETPNHLRLGIMDRFRKGTTQVLCNCTLASYGFDLPALSCVQIAKPTKSLMLYLQMLGRGPTGRPIVLSSIMADARTASGWRRTLANGRSKARPRWSRRPGVRENPRSPMSARSVTNCFAGRIPARGVGSCSSPEGNTSRRWRASYKRSGTCPVRRRNWIAKPFISNCGGTRKRRATSTAGRRTSTRRSTASSRRGRGMTAPRSRPRRPRIGGFSRNGLRTRNRNKGFGGG